MQGDVDGEAANDDSQDEVNKAFFDKIIKIPSTLNPANTSFNSDQIHPCFEVLVRSNQITKKSLILSVQKTNFCDVIFFLLQPNGDEQVAGEEEEDSDDDDDSDDDGFKITIDKDKIDEAKTTYQV